MSFRELKSATKVAFSLDLPILIIGIGLFLGFNEGTMWEKVGLVLLTCGAIFTGTAFSFMLALKMK
jgi:hypothetical protein